MTTQGPNPTIRTAADLEAAPVVEAACRVVAAQLLRAGDGIGGLPSPLDEALRMLAYRLGFEAGLVVRTARRRAWGPGLVAEVFTVTEGGREAVLATWRFEDLLEEPGDDLVDPGPEARPRGLGQEGG